MQEIFYQISRGLEIMLLIALVSMRPVLSCYQMIILGWYHTTTEIMRLWYVIGQVGILGKHNDTIKLDYAVFAVIN